MNVSFMYQSKKITAAILGISILTGSIVWASAVDAAIHLNVIQNGHKIKFPDTQPYIDENSRTMVPVRFISEQLGADVKWHEENLRVDIALDGKNIGLQIGSPIATVNNQKIELDTQVVMKNGRTCVPLRFVSEALGRNVRWDNEAYAVIITDKDFEQSGVKVDAWGRAIRTTNLPSNAADWPYILEDIPNEMYEMEYRENTYLGDTFNANEASKSSYYIRRYMDKWADKIKNYYNIILNVDYREIDDPEAWANQLRPYLTTGEDSLAPPEFVKYAKWVKEHRIRVEGWADPEPSMTYVLSGLSPSEAEEFTMRTYVRFRIIKSDTNEKVIQDSFSNLNHPKLDIDVWYSGYVDMELGTSYMNIPSLGLIAWPYFAVDSGDNMFSMPGNIRKENDN
jgi:hypothetical protein